MSDEPINWDTPSPNNGDLVLRKVNRDLKDKFKAYCAARGRTMTAMMLQFMSDCVTGEIEALQRRAELAEQREKREIHQLKKKKPRKKKTIKKVRRRVQAKT